MSPEEELIYKAGSPTTGSYDGHNVPLIVPLKDSEGNIIILRPNYNGGSSDVGENPMPSEVQEVINDASYALRWLGVVAALSGKALNAFAGEKLKQEIQDARDRLDATNEQMINIHNRAQESVDRLVGLGANIDDLRPKVDEIRLQILPDLLAQINPLSATLAALTDALSSARSALAAAEQRLAFARNRANFPPGIAGARAQQQAIIAATADVAAARTDINNLNRDISTTQSRLNPLVEDYNENHAEGIAKANDILLLQERILQERGVLASKLNEMEGPLRSRAQVFEDMTKFQNEYADNLQIALGLSQSAVGIQGFSEFFRYLSIGRNYRASAAAISGTWGALTPYLEGYGGTATLGRAFMPLSALVQKGIIIAGETAERGGNFKDYAFDLAEALVGAQRANNMAYALYNAAWEEDPYNAFNTLVDQTGVGIGIGGTILETISPFFSAGVPVGPLIQPATKIAKQGVQGLMQTGVTLGYLAAQDQLLSAPLGSGRISGAFLVLAFPFALAAGVYDEFMGGPGVAERIRDMARNQSAVDFRLPTDKITLRPTMPGVMNPWGIRQEPVEVSGP